MSISGMAGYGERRRSAWRSTPSPTMARRRPDPGCLTTVVTIVTAGATADFLGVALFTPVAVPPPTVPTPSRPTLIGLAFACFRFFGEWTVTGGSCRLIQAWQWIMLGAVAAAITSRKRATRPMASRRSSSYAAGTPGRKWSGCAS